MRKAILLDIDGTLVDSNDLHAEAWVHALKDFGFDVPFSRVRPLIGMGGDKVLPELTGLEKESPKGKELSDHRQTLFLSQYVDRVQALPGARGLVERILDAGHQPVVATSANARELERLLQRGNLTDLLTMRTTSDDAEQSKPEPDIVRAALALAGVSPREALMVGDTPYDLQAAARAHVGFVGLRSGGYDDHTLRGALAIYAHPAELCAHFNESPLAAR